MNPLLDGTKYAEWFELLVRDDALRLDEMANALSNLRREHTIADRFPNAERVAQLRGWANHLRAMSAVRLRARYMP